MEQAKQIEELKLLHGNNWSKVYKDTLAKQRLETILTKEDIRTTCNETSSKIN